MYSVLIVDDEKMIRDGVYNLLAMEQDLELDLLQAETALRAVEILNRQKIDIIITDINMPKMTGLELYDLIRERWAYCKVIFLTGYSEFDYVYKVHTHARYLLKAEDDALLVKAVRESIEEIEQDLLLEQADNPMNRDLFEMAVYERGNLFYELFNGGASGFRLSQETREWLQIPFDENTKLSYIFLRHDAFLERDYREKRKKVSDLYRLIERCFFYQLKGVFFELDRNCFVMLILPLKMFDPEQMAQRLSGNAELFVKASEKNLKQQFAVLIGREQMNLSQLLLRSAEIRNRLLMLQQDEIRIDTETEEPHVEEGTLSEENRQLIRQIVWKLENAFEELDESLSLSLLHQLQEKIQSVSSMHDLFALEVYTGISSRILSLIKRLHLTEELAFRVGTMNLYNVSSHQNWKEAFGYLSHVLENIYALKNQNVMKQTEETVAIVKKYILENINGDTSLYALAEHVHFSQEYLLRLFKKSEGVTILQYINDLKLEKAKELLRDSDLQMKEIAEVLGFNSAGYFGRFFRSKTGKTPQNYREATRK